MRKADRETAYRTESGCVYNRIKRSEIKNFERIARKYGVDYAVKKVKTDVKPKYVIFFKARDADALTQAFTEYSRKTVEKEKKPSVLKKLRDLSAVVKGKVLERTRDKQRGQSR